MNNDNDDYIFNVLSNTAALPGMKAENVFFFCADEARFCAESIQICTDEPTIDRRVKSVWFGKLLTGTV